MGVQLGAIYVEYEAVWVLIHSSWAGEVTLYEREGTM